ncbi:DNA ligase D [Salinisphaera aquimarina]
MDDYHSKRDFKNTGEPAGSDNGASQGDGPVFVIHKHAASHLHFDLRLEEGGVLRSWALPKGPSLKPGEKRLAVAVEDHPLDYGDFEGTIPKGQYGGGTVMIWDHGHWREKSRRKKDRIDFELIGEKLTGRWTLAQMGSKAGGQGKNWLLIKRRDRAEPIEEPDDEDVSVVTGRTMEQIADGAPPATTPTLELNLGEVDGARKRAMARTPKPRLARLSKKVPAGDRWLHEIKFDGYRILARLQNGQAQLRTRNGKNWSDRFTATRRAVEVLPVQDAVFDGEIVALDRNGISRFGVLQDAISRKLTDRLVYQIFDLLHLGEYDLRKAPLIERKRLLAELLQNTGDHPRLRYTDHVVGQGPAFLEQAEAAALEGIISKRKDSTYSAGRSKQWRKTKMSHDAEFVVGGFTEPNGARTRFGSLLLGVYEANDRFVYSGRVGTGFSARQIDTIHAALKKIEIEARPFAEPVPDSAGAHWVEPLLVVDVAFSERTRAGVLRHPGFRGLREDREPTSIRGQQSMKDDPEDRSDRSVPERLPPSGASKTGRGGKSVKFEGVRLTHADRLVFPEAGISKLDLARYYVAIADWMLPELVDRPLSLLRCPGGLGDDCFFQRHPREAIPESVPRTEITEKNDTHATYVYIRTAADLVGLIQASALEIHPWGCRMDAIEKPDRLVFDLDPGPHLAWTEVIRVARTLGERLEGLGLAAFPRLTGGKGVHLVVPIVRRSSWDEAKAFARAVCIAHVRDDPKRLTANMSKAKRQGRIYLDYLRNGRGATAIASYSTRARAGAPVAVPIRWDELDAARRADHYDISAVAKRLASLAHDPWEGFHASTRQITRAMRDTVGMK